LDFILGEEIGNTYNRKQLKKLIEIQSSASIREKYGEEGLFSLNNTLLYLFILSLFINKIQELIRVILFL
jgi:hypothetical protein